MFGTFTKTHIPDIFDKLLVVRRILADVSPENNRSRFLIQSHGIHNQHDRFSVIGELSDEKLVVIDQFAIV